MKRPLIVSKAAILLAAFSLAGCATSFPADPTFTAGSTVASAQTKAAESLVVAWRAFDALLTAVDGLQAAGVLTAGSPRALRVADLLDRTRKALNAATDAVRAGDEGGFTAALALAQSALGEAQSAIGGS